MLSLPVVTEVFVPVLLVQVVVVLPGVGVTAEMAQQPPLRARRELQMELWEERVLPMAMEMAALHPVVVAVVVSRVAVLKPVVPVRLDESVSRILIPLKLKLSPPAARGRFRLVSRVLPSRHGVVVAKAEQEHQVIISGWVAAVVVRIPVVCSP